jgi:phosphoglycerate dehydrogenase-like enzyme
LAISGRNRARFQRPDECAERDDRSEKLNAENVDRSSRLDNVLATPHIGYVAQDLYRTFYGDTATAVAEWLDEMPDRKRS